MDVSVNPVLESVRPFFQGLPANNTPTATSNPSHPGVATPVPWPQRPKTPPGHGQPSAKSPALPVYNGTKLGESEGRLPLTHNLPPVAAAYQHSRTATAAPQHRHMPLPSISQTQFRTPDYPHPPSNHHSIYSPTSASNQSHSRSSSSYQSQMLASKYQSSPSSPVVSTPSPHTYSYSPRTSLSMSSATTSSSPAYPQTTSASSVYVSSSHHHRQQLHSAQIQQPQQQQPPQQPPHQSRPPSNQQHPSHHPMSPVIQQPTQHHHLQLSSEHQPSSLIHPQHHLSTVQQQPSHHHQQQQQQQQHQAYQQQHTSQHQQLHHGYTPQQQQQVLHQQGHVHSHQSSRESRGQQHQQHHLLSQQHQQLQQQAAMYNQSVQAQQTSSRQSDAEKLAEMQEVLRIKQRQLAAVQAQQQAYYAAAASSSSSRSSSQTTTTTIEASSHQQTTTTQSLPGGPKRESPLDLSVKTVRQSADSTAKDDSESIYISAHDPFQHRSKPPVKTASPRSSVVLPPLQLPSTVIYPHFENHANNQTQNASSGAPKVDFLPNFNAHHGSSSENSAGYQDPNKRQRKSSTPQIPSSSQYPHPPHMSSLPHMGSFKKSNLPSAGNEDPNKQSQYYPATGPPNIQRASTMSNSVSLSMQPHFAVAPSSQYQYDAYKRGNTARYEYLERRNSSSSLQSTSSTESGYHLGKRHSTTDLRHSLPPKIPKVDTWRQTIDQQIEQRLNSYASSRGHHMNGTTKNSGFNSDPNLSKQTISPYSSVPSLQTSLASATLPSSNSLTNRQSMFTSHLSNSSSKLSLSNQYYPHNQQQYPTHGVPPRSTPDLYNNLSQVKLSNPPSNGAADKRVLSILRKRLDTREASNQLALQQQQLLQQSQAQSAHSQDRSKMYTTLGPRSYPQQLVVPSPVITSQSKLPTQLPVGRHHLPSFSALSLDRSAAAMPYSNQKLHIPKAMDSAGHEYSQNNFASRSDVPRATFPPRLEASSKPRSGENGSDFDGLAAFLAARIRTKAELKQVGPSVEQQQRIPTPASGSNSSAHSPRTTPGIFSPPPSTQMHYPAVPGELDKTIRERSWVEIGIEMCEDWNDASLQEIEELGKGTPMSECDRASGSSGSPMKLTKDKYGINSPRRRLFSRAEDEAGAAGEGVIHAREAGLRSSSETSVFDFRESDSDGETASERQSLNEMRKDRDKRLQEKHLVEPLLSPDPTRDPNEIADSNLMDDSFWSGICDQFVDQLEKGGNKVRKRGRRKKCTYIPIETEPIEIFEQFEEIKSESPFSVAVPDVETIKIEKETNDVNIDKPTHEVKIEPDKENVVILKENIKKEEESSDEDIPLSLRKTELQKNSLKVEESTNSEDSKNCPVNCDKPVGKLDSSDINENLKESDKSVVKKELTDSEAESSADESIDTVAKRLRMRKPKEGESGLKRKTRASEKENSTTPQKAGRKKKGVKKKSVYGDGSEFKPGWEAEVYRYKRSLRMPARLINIAGPQSWPRLSVSLPDLDPDSPMTLDSEISLQNKRFESDGESTPTKQKSSDSAKIKSSQNKDKEKKEEDSFINRLIQRYGGKGKKSLRKCQEKDTMKEKKKGPKIIPQSTELQLLPTPSLDCIVKTPNKKIDQTGSQSKQVKRKKSKKDEGKSELQGQETVYLGYFRKKTVADFRDAFAKHNGGFATEHELPPIMLKSRTRTQTRILTQRATIREVFGDDRPASAPPLGCRNEELDENQKDVSGDKKQKKSCSKSRVLMKKRNSNSGITPGTRPGLRSAAFLRSNKVVLKSKQQLLHGGERRKRSKDLIKAYKSIKKYQKGSGSKHNAVMETVIELKPVDTATNAEDNPVLHSEKRLKYRNVRRKLKSSGFDYIRKKKKQQQKKDGDTDSVKEKKKVIPPKPILESEEDIQNEIKGWVINKGLGETVLHRAARLGYTDIAAYCLEKMDHNPSPRDNAGYTPLHDACAKGRLDIARLLLLYGADVSDSAQGGIRPLHEAAESGCVELMRLLLSYGADPLLATYTGLTPLSLAHNHPDARTFLQNHLGDVQGLLGPPWQIHSTVEESPMLGCDPLVDPPSPDPCDNDIEVESGELSLPHLYQLLGEPLSDRWVLFQELGPVLRVKTREALIKQLGQSHRNDFRDLKMTDFYDMARCCSIMGVGDYILNPKAHKVTLVKYSERVRALLNSEKLLVTAR